MAEPFADLQAARGWLARAGEPELQTDLAILNQALHACRIATADPYLGPLVRRHITLARVALRLAEL